MKKFLSTFILGGMMFAPLIVLAEDTVVVPSAPVVNIPAAPTENVPSSIDQTKRISTLVTRSLAQINARVATLNGLKKRINANRQLNAAQKAGLVAAVDAKVTALSNLATEIKAGNLDMPALQAKFKSIYTDYRIYAVFVPKINALIAIDVQLAHATKLDDTFVKIQERIKKFADKGKDVTNWQKALDEAKAKKIQAVEKLNALYARVEAIKLADYPTTSRAVLNEARQIIREVHLNYLKFHGLGRVR